jgi:hypothetical protein
MTRRAWMAVMAGLVAWLPARSAMSTSTWTWTKSEPMRVLWVRRSDTPIAKPWRWKDRNLPAPRGPWPSSARVSQASAHYALCGRGYHRIYIERDASAGFTDERWHEWISSVARCRLEPGGDIVWQA